MDHSMLAAQLFLDGYNCAQAVAAAFSDVTGLAPSRRQSPFPPLVAAWVECGKYVVLSAVCFRF